MFSKFVGLLRSFGGQIMVGKDKNGNTYYYRKLKKVGGAAEKRWVEFRGTPDPKTIPVEWTSWLSGTRKNAPTPQVLSSNRDLIILREEIINLEAQRKSVKLQAELRRKEEEKQRFRAGVPHNGQNAGSSQEDMEVIMRQIDSGESGSSKIGRGKTEEPSHARYTKVRDVKESAEPTTWQPPTTNRRPAEPQGEEEKLKPGIWKP